MVIDIITLFPDMFEGVFGESILNRARDKGILRVNLHNLRDYTLNKHNKVDDKPFGGGCGMVICPEPVFRAVEHIKGDDEVPVVLLCPQGEPFNQNIAAEFAGYERIILLCGHYEGIDERVRQSLVTREISIGDYVLTGGEIPAMVVVDAVIRLLPGVLGADDSVKEESFQGNTLEYPQYTRPRVFRGLEVPEVLLSGDHDKIRKWRKTLSRQRTQERRPDLFNGRSENRVDK